MSERMKIGRPKIVKVDRPRILMSGIGRPQSAKVDGLNIWNSGRYVKVKVDGK